MTHSYDYLRRAAKFMKITEENVKSCEKRMKELSDRFEKEIKQSRPTQEFLNKTYGI